MLQRIIDAMMNQRNGVKRIDQIIGEYKETWDRDTYEKMKDGEYHAINPDINYSEYCVKPFEIQVESFIIERTVRNLLDTPTTVLAQCCRFNDKSDVILIWQTLNSSVEIYRSMLTAEHVYSDSEFITSEMMAIDDRRRSMIPVKFTLYHMDPKNGSEEVIGKGIVTYNNLVVMKTNDEYRTLKMYGSVEDFLFEYSSENYKFTMHHIDV